MTPTIKMVPLSKIKDNPWRDKRLNPIDKMKVNAIVESIQATGEFWVGIYGREVPNGTVQLAFGHQRLAAGEELNVHEGILEAAEILGEKSIPIVIRDFTDGEMLERMVRENMRLDFSLALEAVSAAVKALAQGKIEIAAPSPNMAKSRLRQAPSFVPGKEATLSESVATMYTVDTLARKLGGLYTRKEGEKISAQNSVVAALSTLELLERKVPGYSLETVRHMSLLKIIHMNAEIKKKYEEVQERRSKTAEEKTAAHDAKMKAKAEAVEAEKERKQAEADRKKAEREAQDAETKAEAKRKRKAASEARDREDAAKERKEAAKKEEEKKTDEEKAAEEEQKRQEEEKFIYVETEADKRVSLIGKVACDYDLELDISLSKKSTLKDKERLWKAWQDAGERCKDRMGLYVDKAMSGAKALDAMRKKEEAKRRTEKETE